MLIFHFLFLCFVHPYVTQIFWLAGTEVSKGEFAFVIGKTEFPSGQQGFDTEPALRIRFLKPLKCWSVSRLRASKSKNSMALS